MLLMDDYKAAAAEFRTKTEAFKQGQANMWSVISGQTSKKMMSELKATTDYKAALLTSDILALVKGIKIVSYKFDGHRHKPSTLLNANRDLINYEQGTQHLDDYYKEFKSRIVVIEQYGGTVGKYPIVTASCIREKHDSGRTGRRNPRWKHHEVPV